MHNEPKMRNGAGVLVGERNREQGGSRVLSVTGPSGRDSWTGPVAGRTQVSLATWWSATAPGVSSLGWSLGIWHAACCSRFQLSPGARGGLIELPVPRMSSRKYDTFSVGPSVRVRGFLRLSPRLSTAESQAADHRSQPRPSLATYYRVNSSR